MHEYSRLQHRAKVEVFKIAAVFHSVSFLMPATVIHKLLGTISGAFCILHNGIISHVGTLSKRDSM